MPTPFTGTFRPDKKLFRYYLLTSLCTGPLFPLVLIPLWFKFETLEYTIDDEGVSMRCGILFRQEVHLTYRRIQDIHLSRNIFQRWFGLATLSVQTASGSATPEMTLDGFLDFEPLRDFLYTKMRGARGEIAEDGDGKKPAGDEALLLLREIRDALKDAVAKGGRP